MTFVEDTIIDLKTEEGAVTSVLSKDNEYAGEHFIMATGVDETLNRKLGVSLMQIPTKGYSVTIAPKKEIKQAFPTMPLMFSDKFIIATPRKDDLRITSKLEVGGHNEIIKQEVIDYIVNNFLHYCTPDINFAEAQVEQWCGFRPLTPNDKPLLGRDKKYNNFIYATGLGWLGITLGPAIGKVVSDLITKDMQNNQSEELMHFSGLM